ncbi:MAG: hypothetical protein WC710_11015 [Gallionella sp.]
MKNSSTILTPNSDKKLRLAQKNHRFIAKNTVYAKDGDSQTIQA